MVIFWGTTKQTRIPIKTQPGGQGFAIQLDRRIAQFIAGCLIDISKDRPRDLKNKGLIFGGIL